jgi:rare lipoprotein A (peptidoglycan hydrolase)
MRHKNTLLGVVSLVVLVATLLSFPGKRTPTDPTQDRTTTVALHVARYSQRTEPQEGRHDLVKDAVRVKTTAKGKRVIEQLGEASFYGTGFHGRPTASGTRFNRRGLTAAHPTLPLGTQARITNLRNSQSVRVRITDRGPYVKGRDLDLSETAAATIGLTHQNGEVPVKIEATLPPSAEPRTTAAVPQRMPAARKPFPESGGRRPQGKG